MADKPFSKGTSSSDAIFFSVARSLFMVFLVGYVLISFDSSRSLIFESDDYYKKGNTITLVGLEPMAKFFTLDK